MDPLYLRGWDQVTPALSTERCLLPSCCAGGPGNTAVQEEVPVIVLLLRRLTTLPEIFRTYARQAHCKTRRDLSRRVLRYME